MGEFNTSDELVLCMICGKQFSTLSTHIIRGHKLSVDEYLKQFPKSKVHSDVWLKRQSIQAKKRFTQDPTLRQKVSSRTFDFVKNKSITPLLQRDLKSARICLNNELWKPSIILYGSIIEAVLLDKHLETSNFYEALEKTFHCKEISEKEYHKIHLIRNLRNYVHIHKELSEGEEINEHWAKTFADICESIIKRFNIKL